MDLPDPTGAPASTRPDGQPAAAPLCVLFVDDDPSLLEGLRRSMGTMRTGWDLLTASSAPTALHVLAAQRIDVVVSDMRMPGMSGAELHREVLTRYPWIIRIILSGMLDLASLVEGSRWSERYLSKPCPPERLRDEIRAAVARRDEDHPTPAATASAGPRPTLLMVEDNPGDIELLREAFAELGHAVDIHAVPNGLEALAFLARGGAAGDAPRPHVILVDLNMPLMNGYEFLARLRTDHPVIAVPVVMFSSSKRGYDREEAIRHGASAFLVKPETWDRYLDLARNLIEYARLVMAS